MASGNSHSEVKQGVEDEITCPVCQDHFQEPKILPCCHYYCKQCIQKLAMRAGANQPFPCPECRRDTLLPQNDSNQLPTAFFVKISPNQLGKPVKVIDGVNKPIDIAINSAGEVVVAELNGDVVVLDKCGKKLHNIAKSEHQFKELRGIVVDKDDNIYLTDQENSKLFKFNQKHELVKVIAQGQGLEQFNPYGINVCGEQVIVGSRSPPYLYIFHTNLELDRKIDLKRAGVEDVMGIASDEHMNLYICDIRKRSVHVLSLKGQGELLYSFGKEHLYFPHSICISGGLVYVSTWSHIIFVFSKEGKLVASFGSLGSREGQLSAPCGLVFNADGFLFVCDVNNGRLQVF